MNKLKNFPIVNFPNVWGEIERLNFMMEQCDRYKIQANPFKIDRYENIKENILIESKCDLAEGSPGINISFLELMKQWYDRGDEQYGLFCDDDSSFESFDYWNFTWQDFLDHLPNDWQCIQLIRCNHWNPDHYWKYYKEEIPSLKFRTRNWDDWGSSFLCKRSYVKKIIDRYIIGKHHYNMNIVDPTGAWSYYYPIIENLLFQNIGIVYNFPIILENQNLLSSNWFRKNNPEYNKLSYEYYSRLWIEQGKNFSIQQLMLED